MRFVVSQRSNFRIQETWLFQFELSRVEIRSEEKSTENEKDACRTKDEREIRSLFNGIMVTIEQAIEEQKATNTNHSCQLSLLNY